MRAVQSGEVMKGELETTRTGFAHQIAVPANRVSQFVDGRRSVTDNTAPRSIASRHGLVFLSRSVQVGGHETQNTLA